MTGEIEAIASAGDIFVGLGAMVFLIVGACILYQVYRLIKPIADKEEKYGLFEEVVIERHAAKKGIDLRKELIKRNYSRKKNFRQKIEEEIFNETFKKENDT